MDVAAYNERVMGPAHVRNVVDEAVKTAIARRTVAHITIPKDIQDWTCRRTSFEGQHSDAQRGSLQRGAAASGHSDATSGGRRHAQCRLQSCHSGRTGLSHGP